jgi:uncharacterized protein involved in copper resistance
VLIRAARVLVSAGVLAGCAATQAPPLSSSNPASAEAAEGHTPPPPRLRSDALIQKANERLTGNPPVQPHYQPSEKGNMPGMQHNGMNMDSEQKQDGQ